MTDTINGTVVRQRFRNDAGWAIVAVTLPTHEGESTVVATLSADVETGDNFTARGEWRSNPRYGWQFAAEVFTVLPPTTIEQMQRRLVTYPKIGEATAKRIVERFGKRTWEVMDADIDRLAEVRGIGKKALARIKDHHELQHGTLAKIQARLIEHGVSARLAKRIHEVFRDDALVKIDTSPYEVSARVSGFSFRVAEKIAASNRIDPESEHRIHAGIIHTLKEASGDGHVCLPAAELEAAAVGLLRVRVEVVAKGIATLTDRGALRVLETDDAGPALVYLARSDKTEDTIAHAVAMLSSTRPQAWDVGALPGHLSDGQREVIEAVASCGFAVLTGGPGTGKSTVLEQVVQMAKREGVEVILCAPTGRAAKRMSEATGLPAQTIHRLLKVDPVTNAFQHDAQNPLPPGLVVVDETSMVDSQLAESLLLALTREHRVLLVGDVDQLPSVGAGNVLADIIDAAERTDGALRVVRLRQVFRQGAGSSITANAHRILGGEMVVSDGKDRGVTGEFFIIGTETGCERHGQFTQKCSACNKATEAKAHATVIKLATERIPDGYKMARETDVAVLCPLRERGHTSAEAIAGALQQIYTARSHEGFGQEKGGRLFFVGDRVMATKNDYGRGVFNGDIGDVLRIDEDEDGPMMVVDFDGVTATYHRQDLGPLRLAYAMTIHKSQGAEFPAVVIPVIGSQDSIMLRRNLIYTAVTRARRLCVLVGSRRAIARAIDTADAGKRWTGLSRRLVAMLTDGQVRT